MRICTRYSILCRIRHHMWKRGQYKKLQVHEHLIYGTEWMGDNDLYQKQQWHTRYAMRLRKILKKR